MADGLALLNAPDVQIALRAICRKFGFARLEAFGSIVREDFGPESDIDFLATPAAGYSLTFDDILYAKKELQELLGRDVDLIDGAGLQLHWNWIFRRRVMRDKQPIYDSALTSIE